jgi:hypothetical protein
MRVKVYTDVNWAFVAIGHLWEVIWFFGEAKNKMWW